MQANSIVVHVSGFPGSGKTTLGNKIQKMFKNKVVVFDTDGFIQPDTPEGKRLIKMETEFYNGKRTDWNEHRALWKATLKRKIEEFIAHHPNKVIVFVGSLDNFAPPNTIYPIDADYKFVLDVPLDQLMMRYFFRIYLGDKEVTAKQREDYWKKLAKGIYNIRGSDEIIRDHKKYEAWHKKHGYTFKTDEEIIRFVGKLIKKTT